LKWARRGRKRKAKIKREWAGLAVLLGQLGNAGNGGAGQGKNKGRNAGLSRENWPKRVLNFLKPFCFLV
jgi:hypothetical protein